MEWFLYLLPLLLQLTTANIYYIQSTNYNLSDSVNYTLQSYINHTRNSYEVHHYYIGGYYSNHELFLLPGKYFLKTDFIIQNAHNFAIRVHGHNSKIYCDKPFLGITFIRVKSVMLNNVKIINCDKSYVLQSDSKAATNSTSAVAIL